MKQIVVNVSQMDIHSTSISWHKICKASIWSMMGFKSTVLKLRSFTTKNFWRSAFSLLYFFHGPSELFLCRNITVYSVQWVNKTMKSILWRGSQIVLISLTLPKVWTSSITWDIRDLSFLMNFPASMLWGRKNNSSAMFWRICHQICLVSILQWLQQIKSEDLGL